MQAFLGRATALLLLGLADGTTDRGREARKMTLQDVVGRSVAKALDGRVLPQHARHEDERGIRGPVARQQRGGGSVEGRQTEIRQDEVEVASVERHDELELRGDRRDPAREAIRLEDGLDEFHVLGIILQVEDAQRSSRGLAATPPHHVTVFR